MTAGADPKAVIARLARGRPAGHPDPASLPHPWGRLAGLLFEQGGRLAVLSEEGGVFDLMSGRYSANGLPNLDHDLKGHAGDPIVVDRVARGAELIERPTLTMGLSVQSIVLRGLMDRPGFHGKGLLARFLYSVPTPLAGRRASRAPRVPPEVRAAYRQHLWRLLETGLAAGDPDCLPTRVTLSEPGQWRLERFADDLEPRVGRFGDLERLADWGLKASGAVARIVALLHLARHAVEPARWAEPIAEQTVLHAIGLGRYFIAHARAAYDAMGQGPVCDDGAYVLAWLR